MVNILCLYSGASYHISNIISSRYPSSHILYFIISDTNIYDTKEAIKQAKDLDLLFEDLSARLVINYYSEHRSSQRDMNYNERLMLVLRLLHSKQNLPLLE